MNPTFLRTALVLGWAWCLSSAASGQVPAAPEAIWRLGPNGELVIDDFEKAVAAYRQERQVRGEQVPEIRFPAGWVGSYTPDAHLWQRVDERGHITATLRYNQVIKAAQSLDGGAAIVLVDPLTEGSHLWQWNFLEGDHVTWVRRGFGFERSARAWLSPDGRRILISPAGRDSDRPMTIVVDAETGDAIAWLPQVLNTVAVSTRADVLLSATRTPPQPGDADASLGDPGGLEFHLLDWEGRTRWVRRSGFNADHGQSYRLPFLDVAGEHVVVTGVFRSSIHPLPGRGSLEIPREWCYVRVYDLENRLLWESEEESRTAKSAVFLSPDGGRLVIYRLGGASDPQVSLHELPSGKKLWSIDLAWDKENRGLHAPCVSVLAGAEMVSVADSQGETTVLNREGEILWRGSVPIGGSTDEVGLLARGPFLLVREYLGGVRAVYRLPFDD